MAEKLEALRQELDKYYGYLNGLLAGIKPDPTEEIPPKPEALLYFEQIQDLGIPLVPGGVLQQPYIFMQEYAIVKNVKEVFDLNQRAAAESEASNGSMGRNH